MREHTTVTPTPGTGDEQASRPSLGARASGLRRHNLSAILRHLHLSGPASRSELAAITSLNRSTIADLVDQLANLGLAVEDGVTTPTGPGRPSPIVHARPDGATVLAIELAVDSIAAATVGLGGHVFHRVRVEHPRGRSSPVETVQDVAALAHPLLDALPSGSQLAGTGVAVVGLTRRADGFLHLAPNLGWRDVPLGTMIAEALEQSPDRVRIANEADLGALGEHYRGAGKGVDNLVFVSGEVGIGTGLIIGGRPMLGAAGYAGEAGHMLVNIDGITCRCGARGCWETEAGEAALLRHAGASTDVSGLAAVAAFLERTSAGDTQALSAVAEVARWLGYGVADLMNLLNPDLVVLGGLYHRLFEHLEAPMRSAIHERALGAVTQMVTIVPGALGEDAPLIGAGELCFSEFIADPVGGQESLAS